MKTKYMLTAMAGLALGGCSLVANVNDDDAIRSVNIQQGGTPFSQALAVEYRARTVNEIDNEYEWDDAAWYARKGLRANRGEAVMPAEVAPAPEGAHFRYGSLGPVVQVPPARVGELSAAHDRLLAILDSGGRDRLPAAAARAQAFYDCWVEEEWEQDEKNIALCRTSYLTAISQFTVTQAQTTTPASSSAFVAKENTFEVFFDFDRFNIDGNAAKTIDQAATKAKTGSKVTVKLTGHTDAAGTDAYNQALSERRADAVKKQLVKDGLPAADITSIGVGKGGQLVPTADGVREPQNRRTEIILQ